MNDQSTVTKEAVTLSEMARMVGLSRARFYELLHRGVFPQPSRNPTTQRPRYSREQQEECLAIRRHNRGANGEVVLFYSLAPKSQRPTKPRPVPHRQVAPQVARNDALGHLRDGLKQLGIESVTDAELRAVVAMEWPDGHREVDPSVLISTVYRALKRRNTPDNDAT